MHWNLTVKCQDRNILTVNRQRYPPFQTFKEERAIGWPENENNCENDSPNDFVPETNDRILLAVWCEWRRTYAGKKLKGRTEKTEFIFKERHWRLLIMVSTVCFKTSDTMLCIHYCCLYCCKTLEIKASHHVSIISLMRLGWREFWYLR